MITPLEISVNAAQPAMPLAPLVAFLGSPSSLRLVGVPRAVGSWRITAVAVTVTYPDGSIVSRAATSVSGTWVATLDGCATPGLVTGGYTITADGIDERGEAVSGYVLGRGDVVVLDRDGTVTVGETTYYLHLLAAKPDAPKRGDVYAEEDTLDIYNGIRWFRAPSISALEDLALIIQGHYSKGEADEKFQPKGSYVTLDDIRRVTTEIDQTKANRTLAVSQYGVLNDSTIKVYDASGEEYVSVVFVDSPTLPDGTPTLRFCELLLLNVSADGAVTLSLPSGTYQFAEGADKVTKGNSHYCFAEYAVNCWLVSKSVVAEAATES